MKIIERPRNIRKTPQVSFTQRLQKDHHDYKEALDFVHISFLELNMYTQVLRDFWNIQNTKEIETKARAT